MTVGGEDVRAGSVLGSETRAFGAGCEGQDLADGRLVHRAAAAYEVDGEWAGVFRTEPLAGPTALSSALVCADQAGFDGLQIRRVRIEVLWALGSWVRSSAMTVLLALEDAEIILELRIERCQAMC